jgi:hypothetical protein
MADLLTSNLEAPFSFRHIAQQLLVEEAVCENDRADPQIYDAQDRHYGKRKRPIGFTQEATLACCTSR